MKVKNDFPDVELTLKKLRRYVQTLEERREKEQDPEEKEIYELDLKLVDDFIEAVEKYLDSVCNSEYRIERVRQSGVEVKELQDFIESEDKKRTGYHSSIIMNMVMIDRMAVCHGLTKVFDYAEEFEKDFSQLLPTSRQEKSQMTERARIKRREMGNFGLYIAASVTAGMDKDYMISDKEARAFASCESDDIKTDYELHRSVKSTKGKFKRNMNDIIK